MKRVTTKTDNKYFMDKVNLRIKFLPLKNEINILDCFSGKTKIWNKIKKLQASQKLNIITIDKKNNENIDFIGDNKKFLKGFDLSKFDIIDLDSYGIPFEQLEILFQKKYKGIIIGTFIQTLFGALNKKMLLYLNYTLRMINKIPTLFNRNGFFKFKMYLSKKGIKKITYVNYNRNYYFAIDTNNIYE